MSLQLKYKEQSVIQRHQEQYIIVKIEEEFTFVSRIHYLWSDYDNYLRLQQILTGLLRAL